MHTNYPIYFEHLRWPDKDPAHKESGYAPATVPPKMPSEQWPPLQLHFQIIQHPHGTSLSHNAATISTASSITSINTE